jgi:hypothetical protein
MGSFVSVPANPAPLCAYCGNPCVSTWAAFDRRGRRLPESTLLALGSGQSEQSGLSLDAAPVVTNAWPMITNRPKTGNSIITVAGLALGSSDLTATGRVMSSGTCATLGWTSGTTVQCDPGSSSGGASSIAMTITGVVGTRTVGLTFDGELYMLGKMWYRCDSML